MSTEVVTLSLQQVRREVLSAVSIVEAESSAEGWRWDTPQRALGNNISPSRLRLVDGFVKEVIEQQVLKLWVATVCLSDVLEEDGANDAAATPHKSDLRLVEFPRVVLRRVLDEHEPLGIRDDL